MQQTNASPPALNERASGVAGGMRVEGFARPYVVSWNLTYFLVPTGRGQFVSDITPRSTTRFSPRSTESCRKNGLDRVTVEELERIRARMPTPKMFG